jgi:hypothetical protein
MQDDFRSQTKMFRVTSTVVENTGLRERGGGGLSLLTNLG